MVDSVVGALEEVLVAAEEAEALEVLPEAASRAPMEVAALARFRPRPLAAASPPVLLRVMSEVSGTSSFFLPLCFLLPLLTPLRVGHGPFTGGAGVGSSGEGPPADCLVAKAVNKELNPSVDCFYSWEHWHQDNFLFYVIRITPTGQNSEGWAKGVRDNIKGEVNSEPPSSPSLNRNLFWDTI